MPTFLIEIHLADASEREFERAVRMLDAAQTRMRDAGTNMRTTIAGLSRDDGRLVCLVDAPSLESARRLVSLALLPRGRSARSPTSRAHPYSAVTHEAMLTLELKPSLLRML